MSLSCTRWQMRGFERIAYTARRWWTAPARWCRARGLPDRALPWAVMAIGVVGWIVLVPVAIWRLTP
jgi:hypothetical protein